MSGQQGRDDPFQVLAECKVVFLGQFTGPQHPDGVLRLQRGVGRDDLPVHAVQPNA